MPEGKHRGEPQRVKRSREARAAQEAADVKFWEDVAEATGLKPGDKADPRVIKPAKKGKHRR